MAAAGAHLRELAVAEDTLVQPFVPSVLDRGETSIVTIGGELTHVVRKVPADGDWRVQSEFGGTAERIAVEPCHRAFAATVLAAIDPVPLYGASTSSPGRAVTCCCSSSSSSSRSCSSASPPTLRRASSTHCTAQADPDARRPRHRRCRGRPGRRVRVRWR